VNRTQPRRALLDSVRRRPSSLPVQNQQETSRQQRRLLRAGSRATSPTRRPLLRIRALPAPTALPTLTDTPASADALRDDLTTNWQPTIEARFVALEAKAAEILAALRAGGVAT
jgi:hypothetical protein